MCIEQVRNVIGIPVPRVLAWDGGSSNSAESEYILMEEAKGTQLEELWTDMDLGDKFKVVDDVIAIQKKLQSVTFSRFGCPDFLSEYSADNEQPDTATSISDQMHLKAARRSKCLATYHIRPRHMQRIGLLSDLLLKKHFGRQERHHYVLIADLVRLHRSSARAQLLIISTRA